MKNPQRSPHAGPLALLYWLLGLGSLLWLLLRSGTNPRRLAYPCQQAALANSLGFLGALGALVGLARQRTRSALAAAGTLGLMVFLSMALAGSALPTPFTYAQEPLPGWVSPTAIANVFVVECVPVPVCSLDGGTLPVAPPCNDPAYALRDDGVDSLIASMEAQGDYFYQLAGRPGGIVGAADIVVVKVNNQWGGVGNGSGLGRLTTNTDVLKGLIWRIVQHPGGFTGEVVVVENTQGVKNDLDVTPANAEDQQQSYQDVVDAFRSLGYPVSIYSWDDLNGSYVSGGDVGGGYPQGEYIWGNNDDLYILLEDPAGSGTDELAYPKFQTAGGHFVSMRYGIWDGGGYDAGRLTFINMPVLKRHGMAGATIAWKNYIGFITIANTNARYGHWNAMHDFFWGYTGGADPNYGLVGRQMGLVRPPDLNLVDAIWVAPQSNHYGIAVRRDVLLASTDPLAVDWYASEYVLRPAVANFEPGAAQNTSAARAGTFRNATRVNQNSAAAVWPGGSYPYIDLLDDYDGNTPTDAERLQMSAYVVGCVCQAITAVEIAGPSAGLVGAPLVLDAVVTPPTATLPISYAWAPEPAGGQGTARAQYTWATTGTYTITLSVANCGGGPYTAARQVVISAVGERVYLPLTVKH